MFYALVFNVPGIPVSVNHYKHRTVSGRTYVTSEAMEFKNTVSAVLNGRFVVGDAFKVCIIVILGAGNKGDADNFPKLILDSLAKSGAFRDKKGKHLSDAHITLLITEVDRTSRPEVGETIIAVAPYGIADRERLDRNTANWIDKKAGKQ